MYDLLEKAGELDSAKNAHDAFDSLDSTVAWFESRFKGRRVKALVKTRRKNTESAYSTIGDIVRFEDRGKIGRQLEEGGN